MPSTMRAGVGEAGLLIYRLKNSKLSLAMPTAKASSSPGAVRQAPMQLLRAES